MNIELEILESSYWEHFKYAKDLALILPVGHSKRIKIEDTVNEINLLINKIKNNECK